MTSGWRFPQVAFSSVNSCLLALGLTLLPPPALAAKGVPIDEGIYRGVHEALGIEDEFGRWDTTIRLVYDPDGAPAAYSNNAAVTALVAEAFGYWTLVSGIRFELTGVNAAAPDDRNVSNPNQRDGLVRISWGAIGGAAGQAGPIGGFFDSDLGYYPYEDGTIELNSGAGVIESDFELIGVLVHEIGHLLGLGHSDDPDSVMYANPYNFLRYPRPDDIRAMQVLYGAPTAAIDVGSPIPAWLYTVPPQASAATTQFLFKPNFFSSSGSYFEVNNVTVTSVTSSTMSNEFVWFVGAIGGGSTAINVNATFMLVDPNGYLYSKRAWALTCNANSACERSITLAESDVMKTIPGTWKVYVVNEATNQTLTTASLPVTTTTTFNHAPTATLTAVAGVNPAQATFTLTATDPESNGIEVVWHPPGLSGGSTDVRNSFASGGSATLPVNFSLAGTHTFFVEVRDNQPRYGNDVGSSAGEGFQTLLRVTITLPGAALQIVSTQDGGTSSSPSQQVLTAVAKTPATLLVSNSAGSNVVSSANVGFTYGASSDQGATTKTSFTTGNAVIIAGGVSPLAAEVGKAAFVFIVVRTTIAGVDRWTYRNSAGLFVDWPTVSIATLQPAYSVSSLKTTEAFEVFSGNLVAATHRIYIGYRLSGGSVLYYTGQAMILTVSN